MSRKSKIQRRRVALYRFQVIAQLLHPMLSPAQRARLIDEILEDPPHSPHGLGQEDLSKRTIQRWLKTYLDADEDPLRALEPKVRTDRGRSRAVPKDLLDQVIVFRESWPGYSVHEILKRIDHPARATVSRRSVGRALREAGYDRRDKRQRLAARQKGPQTAVDWNLSLWEADFPNAVWQIDSTPAIWLAANHHRSTPVQLQLVNIIDDHSRLVVGGGFTEKLGLRELLGFLRPAIRTYGCPVLLFADQAKIHKARILVEGLPRLGGNVVLGTKGHAPGHGKVERVHQSQESTLIEDLRRSPVQTVEEATRFHEVWRERYAEEVHGETHEAPLSRWQRILGNVRIPSEEEILWAFRGENTRQIDKVGAIKWDGRVYEAPPSHRKDRPYTVTIRYDLFDISTIWIEDEDETRHACPLYRVRSHTERRPRLRKEGPAGLSFRSLVSQDASDSSGQEAPYEPTDE